MIYYSCNSVVCASRLFYYFFCVVFFNNNGVCMLASYTQRSFASMFPQITRSHKPSYTHHCVMVFGFSLNKENI